MPAAQAGISWLVLSVQRLSARARLDQSPESLAHARAEAAAGDESWEQWLAEYERGQALIVALELSMEFTQNERAPLTGSIGGCFVEVDSHRPQVEQQVAELAAGEFVAMGGNLAAGDLPIEVDELGLMYVHVDLDHEICHHLTRAS